MTEYQPIPEEEDKHKKNTTSDKTTQQVPIRPASLADIPALKLTHAFKGIPVTEAIKITPALKGESAIKSQPVRQESK